MAESDRLAKLVRASLSTPRPLTAGAQNFLARLASGSLPTLSILENVHVNRNASGREMLEARHQLSLTNQHLAFTKVGWTLAAAPLQPLRRSDRGEAAYTHEWSPRCPLCKREDDNQTHFTSCPRLEPRWKARAAGAVGEAFRLSDVWTTEVFFRSVPV